MESTSDYGDYIWRGGRRITLRKQPEVVTLILKDANELERVRSIEGVEQVEPVGDGVFKGRVETSRRDEIMAALRAAEPGVIVHHAYSPDDDDATRYYLTDELNVKFRSGVTDERIEQIVADHQLRIVRQYPGASGVTLRLQVTTATGMNPIKVANRLAELAEVEYAEPNLVNRYVGSYVPQDPLFASQWHLRSSTGPQLVADADVSAVAAWDVTRGDRAIVVAVLDDGFDLTHPDFVGAGKVVHPRDFVDGDASPFPVTAAGDYHGTPVAGVAIAEENGTGSVGIAPDCALMPVRFPLTASDSFLWEIFDFAGQHADVISCSWGPPPVNAPISQLLADKFHELSVGGGPRKKGCLILFAAGNNNAPLDDPHNTHFVWRHPERGLITTTGPILAGEATHPDTIAVAAATSQNRKAAYSNWGPQISVCAPSNNFHPVNPQQSLPGRGIVTTDNEQHGGGFTPNSRYTNRFGGTSSATPLAAGVAALVLSANPELTAAEARAILEETADKIEDRQPDVVLGETRGTYDAGGHSHWFGFGRVNAARAVVRAAALRSAAAPALLRLVADARGRLEHTQDGDVYRVSVDGRLRVTLHGPDGQDFDLYLKRDGQPSPQSYDARGYTPTANEAVAVEPLVPGEYQILVHSYRGAGEYELRVELE